MPVMLVYGDSDMIRPEHIVEFYQLLGGGLKDAGWQREHMPKNRLAILPDLTHYEMFIAPALAATVLPFLNGESGAKSWAEQVKGTKIGAIRLLRSGSSRQSSNTLQCTKHAAAPCFGVAAPFMVPYAAGRRQQKASLDGLACSREAWKPSEAAPQPGVSDKSSSASLGDKLDNAALTRGRS